MSTVLRLLKLQIDNKTDLLKTATPKTMITAISKALFLLILGTFGVSLALSRVMILGFAVNAELLSLILLVTQIISLAFATGNVINTLYLCKDNEMLVCLPIKPNQLFISKLLMIYINELAVNASISFPIFYTLGVQSYQPMEVSYYLSIPIMLILLPLLPIAVAAFLSVPLMWVIRFLKKHTALAIVTVFSLVAVCLWVYVSFIGGMASEFNIANEQYETVKRINAMIAALGSRIPVYYQLAQGMFSFSKWYFYLIFIAGCAVVVAATVLFTRYFFFKIAMTSLENTVKHNKKKEIPFRARSTFASLFIKEFRCVFRSTTDVFEYFLFTILMPFIVFSYDRLLMSITVNQAGVNMIAGAHVMVVAILAMLSNISSASAVSRDGGNFYTSKIIPVDYFTQMFAKFSFNAVFTIGALILTAIISCLIYPVWQIVLGTVAITMAAIGHIAYCIDSDIKNPTVNLQGDEESSTVSKTTPKALVSGLIIGFILGIIVIMMSAVENVVLPYIIIICISFVFMVYRVHTMVLRINLTYDKIEM